MVATAENGGEAPQQQAPPVAEEPPKLEDIVTPDVLDAVAKGYKPSMKVGSYNAKIGSNIGDNYMSIMYAVDMNLEDEKTGKKDKLKIMLKTMPRNVYRAEMINEMKAFRKESEIYGSIFPLLEKFQNEKEIPECLQFAAWPKCYATHIDGATDYLAMEDLKVKGYKMESRTAGLDFNHCALVLRNLGRYHACSFAKYNGDKAAILKDFPVLEGNMFSSTNSKTMEQTQQFFAGSFMSQAEGMISIGEEVAAARLKKLATMDFSKVIGGLIQDMVDFPVITHGDCWVNNMLFMYQSEDDKTKIPVGMKFLDFQLCTASSRLLDIYYFLYSSSKLDVLNSQEENLLRIYYSEFTSFAEILGVKTLERGLTWENFQKEAARWRLYGVFMGLLLAPMMGADAADIPDLDTFSEEDMQNPTESINKFYKDITKGNSLKKAANFLLVHLPKCEGMQEYL